MFWFLQDRNIGEKLANKNQLCLGMEVTLWLSKRRFIVNYDRVIEGFKLANDIMLSSLLIAKPKGGNYPVGQKQFYENLRAVANGEKNKNARNVSETAAINR